MIPLNQDFSLNRKLINRTFTVARIIDIRVNKKNMNALLKLSGPVLGTAAANGAGVITVGDARKNIFFSFK